MALLPILLIWCAKMTRYLPKYLIIQNMSTVFLPLPPTDMYKEWEFPNFHLWFHPFWHPWGYLSYNRHNIFYNLPSLIPLFSDICRKHLIYPKSTNANARRPRIWCFSTLKMSALFELFLKSSELIRIFWLLKSIVLYVKWHLRR